MKTKTYVRIKPKPAPPKLVPWQTLDEIPVEDWYRRKGDSVVLRVTAFNLVAKLLRFGTSSVYETLQFTYEHFEHSPNGLTDWRPCGKEARL